MKTELVCGKWRILPSLALIPLVLACHGCVSEPTHRSSETANKSGPMGVYVDIGGDPALARRFSSFLEFSLEDADIVRAKSESEADVFIDGEVTEQRETHDIGIGIVRTQLSQRGQTSTTETCATFNSNADGELFDGAAKNTISNIREKFQTAKTVRFDASSDTKASEVFGKQLPIEFRNAGFNLVDSGTPDIVLHIDLIREKVAVSERLAKYDIQLHGKDEQTLGSTNGTTVVSAKLAGRPLEACPGQFEDLSWLAGNSLYSDADRLVKGLLKKSMKTEKLGSKTGKR